MIIWRGAGILTPILTAVIYYFAGLGTWYVGLARDPFESAWFMMIVGLFCAIINWKIGVGLNNGKEGKTHDLFFIPMQYWSLILLIPLLYSQFIYEPSWMKYERNRNEKVEEYREFLEVQLENPITDDYYQLRLIKPQPIDKILEPPVNQIDAEVSDYVPDSLKKKNVPDSLIAQVLFKVVDFSEEQVALKRLDILSQDNHYRKLAPEEVVAAQNGNSNYSTIWVDKEKLSKSFYWKGDTSIPTGGLLIPEITRLTNVELIDIHRLNGVQFSVFRKRYENSEAQFVFANNNSTFIINDIEVLDEDFEVQLSINSKLATLPAKVNTNGFFKLLCRKRSSFFSCKLKISVTNVWQQKECFLINCRWTGSVGLEKINCLDSLR